MDKTDIIETTKRHVACEGDGEISTHPKIYLKIWCGKFGNLPLLL